MKLSLKKSLGDLIFGMLLALIIIFYMWNVNYVNEWNLTGDSTDGHYTLYAEIAQIIHDGELPLWSSLHGGMTAAGNPISQAFYPVTNILCRLCYSEKLGYLSYNILHYEVIIHLIILAWGLYFLIRIIGKRKLTAFIVALLCSLTSCVHQMHEWKYIWGGLVYMPLIVGCAIGIMRNLDKKGLFYCVLGGIFLGLSGLSAPTQGILINIVAFIIVYICYFIGYIKRGKIVLIKLTWRSLLCGLLGIGYMAVTLFPVAEFIMNACRYIPNEGFQVGSSRMSYEAFVVEKLGLSDVLTILFTYWGWWSIGMILTALFLIGLIIPKKWDQDWFVGAGLVTFSILYGCGIIVTRIMYYIPFYNAIREPYLYTFMAIVGVAVIAANGFESLADIADQKISGKVFVRVISIIALLCLTGRELHQFRSYIDNRKCDMWSATNYIHSINQQITDTYLQYINKDEVSGRVWQWASAEKGYPVNASAVLGWNDLDAYMNPYYVNTYYLKTFVAMDKRVELQNVEYIVCSSIDESKDEILEQWGYTEIAQFEGCHGAYNSLNEGTSILYKRDNGKGYGWMVYDHDTYDNETDVEIVASMINESQHIPFESSVINADSCEAKTKDLLQTINKVGNNEVILSAYNHDDVSFQIKTDHNGIFITSEIYAPGWKAYIDGKKADIIEVNLCFRGVVLPQGEHIVEFRYMPASFVFGIIYLVISVIFSVVLILYAFNNKFMKKLIEKGLMNICRKRYA